MININPYLTFDGNCKEAMEYYKNIFGGEIFIHSATATNQERYFSNKNAVLHSTLKLENGFEIMASDNWKDQKVVFGNSVYISINCSSLDEINSFFEKLSKDAKFIKMPLEDTFWNAKFGILTDKFGICWMFNFDYPKKI